MNPEVPSKSEEILKEEHEDDRCINTSSNKRGKWYAQQYRKAWELDPLFEGWLCGVPIKPEAAYCRYCKCILRAQFSILKGHESSVKHRTSMATLGIKPSTKASLKAMMPVKRRTGERVCSEADSPCEIETVSDGDETLYFVSNVKQSAKNNKGAAKRFTVVKKLDAGVAIKEEFGITHALHRACIPSVQLSCDDNSEDGHEEETNIVGQDDDDEEEAEEGMSNDSDYLKNDEYFVALAQMTAARSKHPMMKEGACIVDMASRVVGTGCCTLCHGWKVKDFSPESEGLYQQRAALVCHAEANAIFNKSITSLQKCTMYCTCFPCNECAKQIAVSGIHQVFYTKEESSLDADGTFSKLIFDKAGIKYRKIKLTRKKKELIYKNVMNL